MTRWEFKVLQIAHRDGTYSSNVHIHPEDLECACNKMGAEGWDFCETNTGSILLFKRAVGEDPVVQALQGIRDRLDSLMKPSEVDEATLRGEA